MGNIWQNSCIILVTELTTLHVLFILFIEFWFGLVLQRRSSERFFFAQTSQSNYSDFDLTCHMRSIYPLLFLALALTNCSVPKVMNQSGRVTQKGQITVGGSYMANVSQESAVYMTDAIKRFSEGYNGGDTAVFSESLADANAALVAFTIDPLAFGPQFYLRVGVWDRLELGYTRSRSTNMFSLHGQFLGYEKERQENSDIRWSGSAGLQYSWRSFSLPDYFGNIQSRLGYGFSRRDFLIPATFSYSFGPNEEFGALGFGAVLGIHAIDYDFKPEKVFNGNGVELRPISHQNRFNSIGFFVNMKLGYKFIYLIPSMSVYYQNYGTYPLANGNNVTLKGYTFVPGISLQLSSFGDWNKSF